MPSLISQMRNGPMPQQQSGWTPQLDQATAQARAMMQQLQMASNKEAMLKNMISNNPQFAQIAAMMKTNPNGLDGIAKQMAQANGIDINQLLEHLSAK